MKKEKVKEKMQNQVICNEQTRLPKKEEANLSQKAGKNRKCPIEFFMEEKDGTAKLSIKRFTADKEDISRQNELQQLSGTSNSPLADSIITSGVKALPNSMDEAKKNNIVVQSIYDSEPKDANEARLAAQAAVLYSQGMDFLERARSVLFDDETFAKHIWHPILMNTALKLLNLHTKTIEALVHYRQKGEQKITVQHQYVQVNGGGQAIVGQVGGGEQQQKISEVPHGNNTDL